MKTTSFVLAVFGAVWAFGVLADVPMPANAKMKTAGGPLVQGHRGSRGEYGDNAAGGFKWCLEQGVRGFETDIRFSKDHKLVIMHDNNLKRTTDGTGVVEEMTLDEIRKFRMKAHAEPIPTLDDVLDVFERRGDIFIELEMKAYPGKFYTPEVLEEYCRALTETAKRKMAPGTYAFTSFDVKTLATMRRVAPDAPIGLILSGPLGDKSIETAKSLGCCSVAPVAGKTTKEMIDKAHEAGLSVCLWMCQKKNIWDLCAEKGADRVTSDYPVKILRAIEESRK